MSFFIDVSFNDIDTYVACPFSLFFLGGSTLKNTTSRFVPGFVPS